MERALRELTERGVQGATAQHEEGETHSNATVREAQLWQMAYGAVLKALLYMLLEQELNLPSLAGYEDPRALMEEVDRGDGGADIRGDSISPLKTICEGLSRALALKYA